MGANKNLWRAMEEFELEKDPFDEGDSMGIWDGKDFVLTVRNTSRIPSFHELKCGHLRPDRAKLVVGGTA